MGFTSMWEQEALSSGEGESQTGSVTDKARGAKTNLIQLILGVHTQTGPGGLSLPQTQGSDFHCL